MKHAVRLLSVVALAALASTSVWANGQEFFDPGADAKLDLGYVGRVRDTNGRFLKAATVVFWSDEAALTFPSVTDAYGHYRTPDIGASIKEIGYAVNPAELKATASLPGWELAKAVRIPKRDRGRVVVNFVLRPAGSGPPLPTSTAGSGTRTAVPRPPASPFAWMVPGLLVFAVIGAAVRR